MTFGIFDTERRGYEHLWLLQNFHCKADHWPSGSQYQAEYPTAHIVQEAYTGTSILRPEWSKLYRVLKDGDTVVFDSVSRMSRNAEEGFSLYEESLP